MAKKSSSVQWKVPTQCTLLDREENDRGAKEKGHSRTAIPKVRKPCNKMGQYEHLGFQDTHPGV